VVLKAPIGSRGALFRPFFKMRGPLRRRAIIIAIQIYKTAIDTNFNINMIITEELTPKEHLRMGDL
jgi:hypothetical protein